MNNSVRKVLKFAVIVVTTIVVLGMIAMIAVALFDSDETHKSYVFDLILKFVVALLPIIFIITFILAASKEMSGSKNENETNKNLHQSEENLQQTSQKLPNMIRCKYCRSLVEDDEKICKYCGAKLEK